MSKVSKAKQFRKYLVRRLMVLEGNLEQWAMVDSHLGEEQMLRIQQALAIREADSKRANEIHDQRIACLEKALEIMRSCPACGRDDHSVVEEAACGTPDDEAGSGEPGAAAGGRPPKT